VRIDTTNRIRTPERVRFRQRVSGPGRRTVAWLIDSALQLVVLSGVGCVAALLGASLGEGVGTGALLVALFLCTWFYGAFFETILRGRTPGKLVLALRVVSLSGAPARPAQYLLRNLLRGVDFLPVGYGVGVVAMAVTGGLRRVGDLVAGTIVIDERRWQVRGDVVLSAPVTEEERRALPARVEMTLEEQRAVEAWIRRRERLSAGRAEELAALLSPRYRTQGIDAPTEARVLELAYARASGRDREVA
jgi:uncharacterized RDD family membrane protein YckC